MKYIPGYIISRHCCNCYDIAKKLLESNKADVGIKFANKDFFDHPKKYHRYNDFYYVMIDELEGNDKCDCCMNQAYATVRDTGIKCCKSCLIKIQEASGDIAIKKMADDCFRGKVLK